MPHHLPNYQEHASWSNSFFLMVKMEVGWGYRPSRGGVGTHDYTGTGHMIGKGLLITYDLFIYRANPGGLTSYSLRVKLYNNPTARVKHIWLLTIKCLIFNGRKKVVLRHTNDRHPETGEEIEMAVDLCYLRLGSLYQLDLRKVSVESVQLGFAWFNNW